MSQRLHNSSPTTVIMSSDGTFNWPDGDVILRATHGEESRDFRVHRLFLSFSSPVFKDMFRLPQPSSTTTSDGVEVVGVTDPPRALELILRFVYPSAASPVIDDLTILSEALLVADKYDIEVARSRLRSSFKGFAETEPLRAYAVACRLGLEDEMKIASSKTTSIHLPGLAQLPDEFKLVSATEYHRLVLLHSRYRKEVEAIAMRSPLTRPRLINVIDLLFSGEDVAARARAREATRRQFANCIGEGVPLNRKSLTLALRADNGVANVSDNDIEFYVSSILSQASDLDLTV